MLVTVCLASFELWVFNAFSRLRTTLCNSQRGAGAGAAPCGQRRRETAVAVGQDPHPPGTSLWHPAGPGLVSGVRHYPESWAGPWEWAQAGTRPGHEPPGRGQGGLWLGTGMADTTSGQYWGPTLELKSHFWDNEGPQKASLSAQAARPLRGQRPFKTPAKS